MDAWEAERNSVRGRQQDQVRGSSMQAMKAMLVPILTRFLFCLALILAERGEALVIYRLGGEDLPVPEAATEEGVDFVQLFWADVDDDLFGSSHQLETSGSLIPVRLAPSVNLTPLIRERGGRIQLNNSYGWQDQPDLDFLFDGDYNTAYQGVRGDQSGSQYLKGIWIDFAGLFPIRRVVLQPSPKFLNERFVKSYVIGTNDGDIRKRGTREYRHSWRGSKFFDFDVVYNVTENRTPVLDLELPDVPIAEMLVESPSGDWEIAELEIYGDGYVARANYVSNIFDLGGRSSLGDLTWSGSEDPGAGIRLSMRTGDDEDPNSYWRLTFRGEERSSFDHEGKPLDRRSYNRLEGGEKGGIAPDSENWGFWTAPLDFDAGRSDLVGGKPRRFVQIKADFFSTKGSVGSSLDFLQFEVSTPPVASEVMAEIFPREAPLGETTLFIYKLLPRIQGDDLGFDSIQITTPLAPVSVDEVRIGSTVLSPGEFDVTPYDGESFSVQVPRVDLQSSGELIEVVFQSEVFKVGTVFAGRVFDSQKPFEVRQRVTEGDADPLVEGNSLSVSPTTVSTRAIQALVVSAITPNGDGVNDVLQVEYDLVNLSGAVPVELDVFNLAGERVAGIEIEQGTGDSGRFTATWDGRDGNQLQPPGIYLIRLKVEADEEIDIAVAPVPLVY